MAHHHNNKIITYDDSVIFKILIFFSNKTIEKYIINSDFSPIKRPDCQLERRNKDLRENQIYNSHFDYVSNI